MRLRGALEARKANGGRRKRPRRPRPTGMGPRPTRPTASGPKPTDNGKRMSPKARNQQSASRKGISSARRKWSGFFKNII